MPFITNDPPAPKTEPFITNDPAASAADADAQFMASGQLTPEQAVQIKLHREARRLDPSVIGSGVVQGLSTLGEQVAGAVKEMGVAAAPPPTTASKAIQRITGANPEWVKVAGEAFLRGSQDLGQLGKDITTSQVLDPLSVVKRAVENRGIAGVAKAVLSSPSAALAAVGPSSFSRTTALLPLFPQETAEVLRESLIEDRATQEERMAQTEGKRSLLKDVATAAASTITSPETAQRIGEAAAPSPEFVNTTDFASNLLDPTLLTAPGAKALGRMSVKALTKTAPPIIRTAADVGKAVEGAGALQRAAQKTGAGLEKAGGAVSGAAEAVQTFAEKNDAPLSLLGTAAGAVKGPVGAAVGVQLPRIVDRTAEVAKSTSKFGTALRTVAGADWKSSIPVWRQVAKNPEAPQWLVKGMTQPILGPLRAGEVAEQAVRSGADVAKGAASGGLMGLLMVAGDSDKTGEELGGGIGSGIGLGTLGSVLGLKALNNERKAAAFAHDAMRKAAETVSAGTSPEVVARTPDALMHTAVVMENLFQGALPGKSVKIDLMDAARFGAENPGAGVAAFFNPETGRVAVNLEAGDAAGRQLHELAHAVMASAAGNNPAIVEHFRRLLGSDGLARARQDYQGALGRTVPETDEFIVGELFSEAFADAFRGINLNEALPAVLGRDQTRTFFRDGDVRKALKDPSTQELVRQQFNTLRDFRPAVDMEVQPGVKLKAEDAGKHPALPVEQKSNGTTGNDFVEVTPDGKVRETPAPEVRRRVRSRRKEVETLFPDKPEPTPPSAPTAPGTPPPRPVDVSDVQMRVTPSGLSQKTGTKLGDKFYATAQTFGSATKAMLRRVEQAIAKGETMAGWYQQIGKGDGWAANVRETLGAVEAQFKDFIPYAFKVDKQGNLLVENYSLTALERKAAQWGARSGPLSLDLWNGDISTFKQDVQTYLKNHAEGRPGGDGIGETKRNVINAFLVGGNRTFEALNPLRAQARGKDRQGIVRSYRADRLQTVEPSDMTGFQKPDYAKQVKNLSPEVGGHGVRDHREARDYWEKGYTVLGAPYDGNEAPIRLTKPEEIQQYDPENLWVVPPEKQALDGMRNSPQVAPEEGFYSKLEDTVRKEITGASMPAAQLLAVLRNRGVKSEEMRWVGAEEIIRQLAEQNGGKVPKDQLLSALKAKDPQLGRVERSEKASRGYVIFSDNERGSTIYQTEREAEIAMHEEARQLADLNAEQLFVEENEDGTGYQIVDTYGDPVRSVRSRDGELLWEPEDSYASEYRAERALKERAFEEAKATLWVEFREDEDRTPQYEEYTLPGGSNYREVILTLPKPKDGAAYRSSHFGKENYVAHMRLKDREIPATTDVAAVAKRVADFMGKPVESLGSGAPDFGVVRGVISPQEAADWSRAAGYNNKYASLPGTVNPGLFIEEIQSDRHQEGRKEGYAQTKQQMQAQLDQLLRIPTKERTQIQVDEITRLSSDINSRTGGKTGVPDAPFRKDWGLQMFKRALNDAVESGKKWIGWTTGDTQAERYDLSKQVSQIAYKKNADGTYALSVKPADAGGNAAAMNEINGRTLGSIPERDLPSVVGKEVAEKIVGSEGQEQLVSWDGFERVKVLSGLDLKVGGEGMKGFYDEMLPKEVAKYVKKYGATVEKGSLPDGTPMWRVDISPEMSRSIQRQGQERFSPKVEDPPNLVAMHNTTAEGIRSALKLGGLPVPSLGVTKKDTPFTGFGDITLVADKAAIDPQADRRNRVFDADVYSPRQPRPFQALKRGAKDKLTKRLAKLLPAGFKNWWEIAPGQHAYDMVVEKGEDNVAETARKLRGAYDVQAAFLTEKGVEVPRLMKDPPLKNRYLDREQLADPRLAPAVEHGNQLVGWLKTPDGIAFSDVVRELLVAAEPRTRRDLMEQAYGKFGEPLAFGKASDIVDDLRQLPNTEKVVDRYRIEDHIREEVQKRKPEFDQWVDGLVSDLFDPNQHLVSGRTKKPYTLDNLVGAMSGDPRAKEGGMTYSLGKARSNASVEAGSLDAVRSWKSSLTDEAGMSKFKAEVHKEFSDISDLLGGYDQFNSPFERLDRLSEAIGKATKRPSTTGAILSSAGFKGVPAEIVKTVRDFATKLSNAPTEYFEAKPQRAVGLQEFKAAVVPENTPEDVVNALREAGLRVETYTDTAGRKSLIDRVASEQNLLFSPEVDERPLPMSATRVLYADSAELPPPAPGTRRTNEDVARMLQGTAIDHWGKIVNSTNIEPSQFEALVRNAVEEVKTALAASGKNAADWYTHAIERAVSVLGVIHPELVDDAQARATGVFPNARAARLGMFTALAITSQNLSVAANAKYSLEQFTSLARTGKFDPSKEYGSKAASISGNLDLANQMIEKVGWEGFGEFISRDFAVKDLEEAASAVLGRDVSIAGRRNDIVQGAAIFGPKIGQGFLQNLLGNYAPVTIDLWMRRTWGRWTGDVMEADVLKPERVARLVDAARARGLVLPQEIRSIRTVMRTPSSKKGKPYSTLSEGFAKRVESDKPVREALLRWSSELETEWNRRYKSVKSLPVSPEDLASLRSGAISFDELTDRQLKLMERLDTQYARLKEKPATGKGPWREEQFRKLGRTAKVLNEDISANKPEWVRSMQVIQTSLGPIDIPSDQDRAVITRLVNTARERLKQENFVTSNADIQAILWYPEKDIWAKLAGDHESDLKQSYDDEFLRIAESRGLGDAARKAAAESDARRAARTDAGDDSGAARPDGGPAGEAGGDPAAK